MKGKINVWPSDIFHLDLEMGKEKLREVEWLLTQSGVGTYARMLCLQVWGLPLFTKKVF